jgi:hypothetical protein
MKNSVLKFGKFKGMEFQATPQWYQEWLLKQDWFKKPVQLSQMQEAQKEFSKYTGVIKGWNGHSKKGAAAYDRMFEAEMKMEKLLFCGCGQMRIEGEQCLCGGIWD